MNASCQKPTLDSVAYVEMYVGNIYFAKCFYLNSLKFQHIATHKDPDTLSYLLKQGDIYIILTTGLTSTSSISQHIAVFGDCIKKISFWVEDVKSCFESAIKHHAIPAFLPNEKNGVETASIEMFNQVEYEFIKKGTSHKIPGFLYNESDYHHSLPMIFNIDHIATCYPADTIPKWVEFFKAAFGFSENKNEDIYSEQSGMHIIIMKSPNGRIKLPLVEPSSLQSPLNIYLNYNGGAGVHHIAFETHHIIDAVKYYENNFGELRKAPSHYYEELKISHPHLTDNLDQISPYGIMVEQDDKGLLYQIFTRPVVSRPTFFLEFIQREKCEGFGTVNIKSLYESLET